MRRSGWRRCARAWLGWAQRVDERDRGDKNMAGSLRYCRKNASVRRAALPYSSFLHKRRRTHRASSVRQNSHDPQSL